MKYDLGIEKHDQEGRTITVEFDKFILVASYVPNSGMLLKRLEYRTKEWDPDFRNYLTSLSETKRKPVILCGDLNCVHHEIDISKPKENLSKAGNTVEERTEFDKLLALGYIDSFRALYPESVTL